MPSAKKALTPINDAPASQQEADVDTNAGDSQLSSASREDQIRLAAYLAAERRGFEPGYELEDWNRAEQEIADGNASSKGSSLPFSSEPQVSRRARKRSRN